MQRCASFLAGLLLVALAGCVPAQQHQDTEFQLHRVEAERDSYRRAGDDERARSAALAAQLKTEQRKAASAEAEINALRSRLETLQTERDEYAALIEQRAAAPLSRPEVPASPLPPEVDEALTSFAAKYQQRVWYDRSRGAMSFANDRLFDSGSDVVRSDAHAALHELAELAIRLLPQRFEIVVVGHTDDTPIRQEQTKAQHPTNWHLSVHRAVAVRAVLEQAGVPAARLGVMGYGAERPISGDRARNRRVEVFFVPRGDIRNFDPVRPPGNQ
ncbi:MAG: OmpA family protein [Phycisphaerae bacterium]|jgi:chemotaxis protein MotB